jgi:hypothetical protein
MMLAHLCQFAQQILEGKYTYLMTTKMGRIQPENINPPFLVGKTKIN